MKTGLFATAAASVILVATAGPSAAQTDTFSPRVTDLISKLTLDEKIALTWGGHDPAYHGESGYGPGVPRLGIPPLRWANGPQGVESIYDLTALPSSTALAASFDPAMARRFGDVIGLEGRYAAVDVINGPDVGVTRLSNGGGGGYGEDPYLGGLMSEGVVRGIQAHGVMAMAKHYIGHVQALHGGGGGMAPADVYSFVIDDRTLHEIYLPPFETALRAGVASVMAAYSKVNGEFNAENQHNLVGILRDELHWKGWVNSDWGANRSVGSIEHGLDLEMPGYGPTEPGENPTFWGPKLKAAVQSGQVPAADLDRAVGRFLTELEAFGFFDHTRVRPAPLDVEGDAAIARASATEGAVLLKNDGLLPLKPAALANLAFIGPTARQLAVGAGANRSYGIPGRAVSPLDALRATAGNAAHVTYAVGDGLTGTAVPASALTPDEGAGAGLARHSDDGTPTRLDAAVDFVGPRALTRGTTAVWRGNLRVPASGVYVLQVQSWGGSAALKVDGRQRAISGVPPFGQRTPRQWSSLLPTTDNLDNGQVSLRLDAGKTYKIEIDGRGAPTQPFQLRFGWLTPEARRAERDAAIAAAKAADTVVVFAWAGRGGAQSTDEQGAGLPNDQDALIEAVAAANPNTVVVLNSGSAVAMPWKDKVRSILQMWYPGQEGGWATADLLTGKADPSGRLPVTIPVKLEDTPAMQPGHPERYTGDPIRKEVRFSEGVFVGYRWFDQQKIEPLFPFGYGLSYTSFAYSGLKARAAGDGIDVSFTLKNTGPMKGAEVAQVYVGPPARPPVAEPPKALGAFARVELAPGESRTVNLHLAARQLSYWDTNAQAWKLLTGRRPIYVGASSRDIKLTGAAEVSDKLATASR